MLSGTPRTFIGSTTFTVGGMSCPLCQQAVVHQIIEVPGVNSVTVDLPSRNVTVTASQLVDRVDIASAIETAGFTLLP
jgi:copper chaperone CopZ